MRRERLLLEEMIGAAEEAHLLATSQTPESLASDRQRRDALLWNFTVLGEAAAQLPDHRTRGSRWVCWTWRAPLGRRWV